MQPGGLALPLEYFLTIAINDRNVMLGAELAET
jgi:hypothetical protein